MPRLEDETKATLEGLITCEDVKTAVETFSLVKSPGPDGLCAGFHKGFKLILPPFLANIFDEAFALNIYPPSFLTSHTVQIPKMLDGDKLRRVTSYQLISLTSVD